MRGRESPRPGEGLRAQGNSLPSPADIARRELEDGSGSNPTAFDIRAGVRRRIGTRGLEHPSFRPRPCTPHQASSLERPRWRCTLPATVGRRRQEAPGRSAQGRHEQRVRGSPPRRLALEGSGTERRRQNHDSSVARPRSCSRDADLAGGDRRKCARERRRPRQHSTATGGAVMLHRGVGERRKKCTLDIRWQSRIGGLS